MRIVSLLVAWVGITNVIAKPIAVQDLDDNLDVTSRVEDEILADLTDLEEQYEEDIWQDEPAQEIIVPQGQSQPQSQPQVEAQPLVQQGQQNSQQQASQQEQQSQQQAQQAQQQSQQSQQQGQQSSNQGSSPRRPPPRGPPRGSPPPSDCESEDNLTPWGTVETCGPPPIPKNGKGGDRPSLLKGVRDQIAVITEADVTWCRPWPTSNIPISTAQKLYKWTQLNLTCWVRSNTYAKGSGQSLRELWVKTGDQGCYINENDLRAGDINFESLLRPCPTVQGPRPLDPNPGTPTTSTSILAESSSVVPTVVIPDPKVPGGVPTIIIPQPTTVFVPTANVTAPPVIQTQPTPPIVISPSSPTPRVSPTSPVPPVIVSQIPNQPLQTAEIPSVTIIPASPQNTSIAGPPIAITTSSVSGTNVTLLSPTIVTAPSTISVPGLPPISISPIASSPLASATGGSPWDAVVWTPINGESLHRPRPTATETTLQVVTLPSASGNGNLTVTLKYAR